MKYCVLIAAGFGLAMAATVMRDEQVFGIRLREIALSSEVPFTIPEIERLSRVELQSASRMSFAQVFFYGSRGGALMSKPTHLTFEIWRQNYERLSRRPNEIAELIMIGGNAVLRIREADGHVERRILAGKDPLVFSVGGVTYEAIYWSFPEPVASYSSVRVYVRTAAPLAPDAGAELLDQLKAVLPPNITVSLYVRNDEWFVKELEFPLAYPFSTDAGSPNPETYGKTMQCNPQCSLR